MNVIATHTVRPHLKIQKLQLINMQEVTDAFDKKGNTERLEALMSGVSKVGELLVGDMFIPPSN